MTKKLLAAVFSLAATLATAQNPYLPLWEHLPDGEPRVFEDPDNPGTPEGEDDFPFGF